ncbi:2'-5' RNA ligase family protein [Streptomyces xanthochromogenes]|uniref:2'-5' RNA ligase family protein n=1 Tax=Streptomyces xanthochromogenes TaxID=67384 RepID=UPI003798D586
MTAADRMRDHWYWRPGWNVGRRFYTWHLTFEEQHDVHRFAAAYRTALAPVDGLDLIPDRWLHLTMQGIGFVGEIASADVRAIADAATQHLAQVPAFDAAFNTPVVDPEAILVPIDPAAPVRAVRDAIRAAIGEILPEVPESAADFTPHVSIGYSNATGPTQPFATALSSAKVAPAHARITHAELIVIHRDNRMYEWESFARVPLGPPTTTHRG